MTAEGAFFEPIRKSVRVDRTAEDAFSLFTEHIDRWWPVEVFSRAADDQYGKGVKVERVVFEPRAGGRLYEVTSEGVEGVWANVLEYEPPARIVLAWKPNDRPEPPTEVEIRFEPHGAGTLVSARAPRMGRARRTGGRGARGARRRLAAPSGALRRGRRIGSGTWRSSGCEHH